MFNIDEIDTCSLYSRTTLVLNAVAINCVVNLELRNFELRISLENLQVVIFP